MAAVRARPSGGAVVGFVRGGVGGGDGGGAVIGLPRVGDIEGGMPRDDESDGPDMPGNERGADIASGGDAPYRDMPCGDMPCGDMPGGDIPGGDMPGGDIPDGDIPDGDMPGGAACVGAGVGGADQSSSCADGGDRLRPGISGAGCGLPVRRSIWSCGIGVGARFGSVGAAGGGE
jgi:hypothetical protein